MKIRHKEHKWVVENVGVNADKELRNMYGYEYTKICETSNCIVHYHKDYWELIL